MRKQPIIEDAMKSVIRDELALNPLASVHKIRLQLFTRGFRSVNGTMLDWHYTAKVMKKIRVENITKLSFENRTKRLAALKERHRILTEKLIPIVEGDMIQTPLGASYPTQRDRVSAANTILKWDMALFFAEEQVSSIEEMEVVEERTHALITLDTVSGRKVLPQPQNNLLVKRRNRPATLLREKVGDIAH